MMKLKWLTCAVCIILSLGSCTIIDQIFGGDRPDDDDASHTDTLEGTTVSIVGVYDGHEKDQFEAVLQSLEDATGISVEYTYVGNLEANLRDLLDGNDPPDMALIAQPGFAGDLADDGLVEDVGEWLGMEYLEDQYAQSWLDLAAVGGLEAAGVWVRASVKSLVWYNKSVFAGEDYEAPQTWADMLTLSQDMVDDGYTPWTVGIGSGDATGWPATDWIEDIMLRLHEESVYDQWVEGELGFDSDEVREAVNRMTEILFDPEFVLETRQEITTTDFADAIMNITGDTPKAVMHRQATFAAGFLGDSLDQVGVFYLPPIAEDDSGVDGTPVIGSGDLAVAFTDRPEVRSVIEHLTKGSSFESWIADGGFLSPHLDIDSDLYSSIDQVSHTALQDADPLRFDGSDLMPAAVGLGAFFTEITDYIADETTLDEALAAIDESWPTP